MEKSFIANFEAEVHVQYQKMGSKLRNTVRTKDNIIGATTTFQKVGKGIASIKARHGLVPVMNVDHTPVECVLQDYYAGDWVDRIDEIRTNINEQQIVARAAAYALGLKTDDMIINQLADSHRSAGWHDEQLTRNKIQIALEMMNDADVPDDGQRFAVVGWRQWSDLLNIEEFANADYVSNDDLPWNGTQAKRWLGTLWIPHSNLPKIGGVRYCFWYHKTAIGHGIGSEVKTDIIWHGDHAAHFVNNIMSQGACLIDPDRVVTLRCLEPQS